MKIALYIEDGLEQIVLTPQSETEKAILGKLSDGSRELSIHHGSFFECRGGWQRYAPSYMTDGVYFPSERQSDESTMIVLRPMPRIEAGTDETAEQVRPEGQEPDQAQKEQSA